MPNNLPKADFQTTQSQFAAFIRNPKKSGVPSNVKPERMAVYRELFFNNVENFLSSGFPVLRKILDDNQWLELAQDFFSRHQSKTPYFSEISEEFLEFLQNERENPNDYPFLLELAHYEWVEMALAISQKHLPPLTKLPDNLLQEKLKVSPLAWPLAYQYPVHQISPEFLPSEPPEQPTFLCVYRDSEDEVHFLHITAMTFRLLQIIEENQEITLETCLKQLAEESANSDPTIIISGGLEILQQLFRKTIVTLA